ncbi:MAG TPA: DUF1702 family protein, partial [Phycisphaerae bacterium]|nr:DUF1702 family protein [Phycisphaerae bacterium]
MPVSAYIVLIGAVGLCLLAVTGWWRLAFLAFRVRPASMTVQRLGLAVSDPADVHRVNTILQSFASGFNAMISRPRAPQWRRYCDSLPALFGPFAHEGAAMGFTLRRLFGYRSADFEDLIVKPRPDMRYLYYVGLGFWSGMRSHGPRRLGRVVRGLDTLHLYLCYDGYGFKHGFFDYPRNPQCLGRLDAFQGYARNAAYQGVGRAFFFRFMQRTDLLIEHVRRLGDYAADAAGGMGLASVFVFPDRLEVARKLATALPLEWHDDFHVGMCFGLKARSLNDPEQFERDLAGADADVRAA